MEFTIETKKLRGALAVVKAGVARKASKRIFECVRIDVNGSVRFTGTDLEHAMTLDVEATHEGTGAVCAPFKALEAIGKLKAPTVRFATAGTPLRLGATMVTGASSVSRTIECEEPTQYPETASIDGAGWVDVPNLGESILEAKKFTGKEAARFVLNGIKLADGAIVGCDGRRLYVRDLPSLPECGIIGIPRLTAAKLRTVDAVRIVTPDKCIQFRGAGFVWTCKIMEGTYPDYSQIIPKDGGLSCPIDPEAWTDAIGAVQACADETAQAIILRIRDNSVTFEAQGMGGKGTATIDQQTDSLGTTDPTAKDTHNRPTAPNTVGFNPAYLLDALKLEPTRIVGTSRNAAYRFDCPNGRTVVVMPVLID